MGEGHFLDILFLAMVAGFIFFRLRSVLGRRTGNERRPPERAPNQVDDHHSGDDNVVTLPDHGNVERENTDDEVNAEEAAALWAEDSPVGTGLTKIKLADHSFEPSTFGDGAKVAYEMIVDAFAGGDRNSLRGLLSDQVYENFVGAIEEREDRGHTLETKIVSINEAEIVEAQMNGKIAEVTVKFISEMVSVIRAEDGEPLPDQPNGSHEVTDIWTFARDTRNRDPNWQLIETHGEN